MGCGMPVPGVVVGLVVVVDGEGVAVRPVVAPVPPPVLGPLPVVGGVVVPPVPCPITAAGIDNPRTAAAEIALTQTFEAIPPPLTCPHYPTKN
jgi:hypothetical protein